ncbi:ABC transporter permease [Nakamurella lactea]|uniref:ABC transporter permease n=1 Tax=Nakamurella lactea TaxID=459515 RepID=UPI0003FB93A0|nr:ABC transporter permease [Nakamurella lactea]
MTAETALVVAPARTPRRPSVLIMLAFTVLLIVAVLAVFGQWLAPQDPTVQDPLLSVTPPGDGHLLGTDQLGRDVFSLIIAAARSAIVGPVCVALGCVLIGGTLGMVGAYFGGVADVAVNRFADLVYALPALLIAIVVIGVVDGGYWLTAAILIFLSTPYQIRLCRSVTMVQVRLPYVDAARTIGLTSRRTLFRHILPNILPTVVATLLLDFVAALIGYSALAYLGLGVQAGQPDWGAMLAEGQSFITVNPWLSLAPAIMLIATASSVTLVGDWLYDRLSSKAVSR